LLAGLAIIDLGAPPNVTVSALGVFAVLAAAWFLSLRMTIAVVAVGVLLQIFLVAVGSLSPAERARLHIEGVYWFTAVADVLAFLLTAAIGRVAAGNWAEMDRGLKRERALLRDKERAEKRLESVLAVNQSIADGRPIEEVLHLVASRARALAGAEVSAIAIPDGGNRTYTIQAVDGERAAGLVGLRVRATTGSSGSVLRTRKVLVVEDLSSELSGTADDRGRLGAAVLVPIAAGRRRYGTLLVANLRGSTVLRDQEAPIELFAAQAGLALEYRRVQGELKKLALLEDRNRISQELHDGVIQALFAIGLDLESGSSGLDSEYRESVKRSVVAINGAIRDLRGFIYGLAPGLLDGHGVRDALLKLTADYSSKLKIQTTATIDPELADLLAPQGVDLVLFSTEALSNLARHSGATSCSMTLVRIGDDAMLEIRDEGSGFDPDRAAGQGFGLRNLGERAARLRGRLAISSAPGKGTAVRLVIPLKHTGKRARTPPPLGQPAG
jgi:two-component system, NarL family, sensor histidine kinase DevS